MTADPGKETRLVSIKGKSIVIKKLTDAQLIIMGRDIARIEDDKLDPAAKLVAAGYIMDMFESAIVQGDDRDYVKGLARQGEIDLPDFLSFLSSFQATDEATPVAKPVVRRGRTPRKVQ